jgi:hypothetical protein
MSCFGSKAINKNGLIRGRGPNFPLAHKLAIHGFAPPSGGPAKPNPLASRLSNSCVVARGGPSFESNQCAWLCQAKNLSRRFLSRRYPAARDLCGNGCVQKHVAKTGGVYE